MKIRILGNSLRLRLSQQEVKTLQEKGYMTQSIQFGKDFSQKLVYGIEVINEQVIKVHYQPNKITVELSNERVKEWANSNLISIHEEMDVGDGQTLKVLVEKDFKCLTTDRGEDESDLFTNPKAGSVVC